MPKAILNQKAYDFQSIETEIIVKTKSKGSLALIEGLEKFDYKCVVNRTQFFGRSRLPIVITEGDATFDASITINRYWFDFLWQSAIDMGIPFIDISMNISVYYKSKKPGQAETVDHTDTLTGVRFKGISHAGQHGPENLVVELPLDVQNIYWDGVDICGNILGGSDVVPPVDKDNPPPFPNYITDPLWDFVKFKTQGDKGTASEDFYLPGVCTVSGLKLGIDVDTQKRKDQDKCQVRDCGQTPIQFKVLCEFTSSEWEAWIAVLPKLLPKAGVTRTVLAVEHPLINANHISQIFIGRIEYGEPSARKGLTVEITCHEFVDKPLLAQVKKPAQVAQDNAEARQIAVDNIMNQTFPTAPQPKAPPPPGYHPPQSSLGYNPTNVFSR